MELSGSTKKFADQDRNGEDVLKFESLKLF